MISLHMLGIKSIIQKIISINISQSIPEFLIFEKLENRLLWKTIVIQKGLFELSLFGKSGGYGECFGAFGSI